MRDALGHHEAGDQVLDGARLAAVRPQHERVEPTLLSARTEISTR